MANLDYSESTTGSGRPLAVSPQISVQEGEESNEDVIEYVPKRMSKLSDEEINEAVVVERNEKMASATQCCSRCLYSTIIAIVTLALLMTTIVHIFAWYQDVINTLPNTDVTIDWFDVGRRELWSPTQYLMVVDVTFWTWIAIYVMQLFWLFYGMVLTCRRARDGFLYEVAQTMPVTIYLLFLSGLAGTVIWYFLWGHFGWVQWAALDLAITSLASHICLGVVVTAFVSSIVDLREMNKSWDLLWNQLLTQNALAGLAAWQAIVTMYNITSLLEEVIADGRIRCSVGLGLIMLYILVWTIVDIFFSKRSLYFIFTPYALAIVAFTSALVKNLNTLKGGDLIEDYPSLVVSAIFLGITVFFVLAKIIVVAVRGRYGTNEKDEVRSLHDDSVYVMQ